MLPWGTEPAGRFDEHVFDSDALKGNPLGDPHERPLWVYVPPGYDDEPERRYPSVYVIQGLTGQVDMWRNRTPFRRNFPETADELFASGDAPPCIVVWVDAWTSYGGAHFATSTTVRSRSSGRTSAAASRTRAATTSCSTPGAWPRAIPPRTTAPCGCRSTSTPAS